MAAPLSAEAFYESARGFARTALEAHHDRDYRRVALDAGTALEHLLKACLSKRSPALLVELKDEGSFKSLWQLIDFQVDKPPREVRTVSLRNALKRVKMIGVPSKADEKYLFALADMRDGSVHAALDDEVEIPMAVAFVLHADALLSDLRCDTAEFWDTQLSVVNALLAEAGDKTARAVNVKLAGARSHFRVQYGGERVGFLPIAREMAEQQPYRAANETPADCPVCGSLGKATGDYIAEYEADGWDEDGNVTHVSGTVWFRAAAFFCQVCGLRLDSPTEITAAGLDWRWELEGAHPEQVFADTYSDSYADTYGHAETFLAERLRSVLANRSAHRRDSASPLT